MRGTTITLGLGYLQLSRRPPPPAFPLSRLFPSLSLSPLSPPASSSLLPLPSHFLLFPCLLPLASPPFPFTCQLLFPLTSSPTLSPLSLFYFVIHPPLSFFSTFPRRISLLFLPPLPLSSLHSPPPILRRPFPESFVFPFGLLGRIGREILG